MSSAPLLASWSGALRQAGYDVTTAREPGVAVALLSAGAPDIVVVDLGATGRHGLAVLSTARSLYPSVPVLVTGAVGEKLRAKAKRLGCYDVLTPPVFHDQLLRKVRQALDRASGVGQTPKP